MFASTVEYPDAYLFGSRVNEHRNSKLLVHRSALEKHGVEFMAADCVDEELHGTGHM